MTVTFSPIPNSGKNSHDLVEIPLSSSDDDKVNALSDHIPYENNSVANKADRYRLISHEGKNTLLVISVAMIILGCGSILVGAFANIKAAFYAGMVTAISGTVILGGTGLTYYAERYGWLRA